jgi:hypothetical protein
VLLVVLGALPLFVVEACGSSGSSGGSRSSGGSVSCGDVPSGDNVVIDWITFESWMQPPGSVPVVVAFASAVTDGGGDPSGRRKIELQSPEVLAGTVPESFYVDKIAIQHANTIMHPGDRLLVWGWPGFPQPKVFGNMDVASGDGTVTFLGNCIPRFDGAFARFAASLGSSEPAVDVLVRILKDPTGETATRFKATAGFTQAGP